MGKGAELVWASPAESAGLWCLRGWYSALGVLGSSMWEVLERKCSLGNSSTPRNPVRDPECGYRSKLYPLVRLTSKVDFFFLKPPYG